MNYSLQKMEERKDHYKNNFSQAEDRANDEEQGYRAEAEAFEKLRNEYNLNVKELEILERDKSKPSVPLRESRLLSYQHGKEVLFMKYALQAGIVTMMIGKLGYHLVWKTNQAWTC